MMYARGDTWGTHADRGTAKRTGGCTCPAARYDPTSTPQTDPNCPNHQTETTR